MPPFSSQPKKGLPPPPPVGVGKVMGADGKGKEPSIVVMPEKYYGVAAKMEGRTQAELEAAAAKQAAPPPSPKPTAGPIIPAHKRPIWPWIVIFVVVVSIIGGGFLWFNREILFQPPPTAVVTQPPPTPQPAPNAPANLVATVTSGTSPAVSLSWVGGGGNITGYRLERRESEGAFLPLTPLSANSLSFLDVTVRTSRTYQYRVFAIGVGGESSASNIASAIVGEGAPVVSAPTLPSGGLDSDSDGLSDVEEAIFGTDARVPDSDRDGFLDGNEVFHLYNPAAAAPVRLLDSGLVVPFVSPAGWSLFVPKGWTATLDNNDGSRATIRTGQGETFRVSLVDNPAEQTLQDWYIANHPGTVTTQLREISTKGGLSGMLGPERIDAHFAWDGRILILTYDNDDKPFIQFRTTYEMMLNSLRLSGVPVVTEPTASTLEGPGEFLATTSTTSTSP